MIIKRKEVKAEWWLKEVRRQIKRPSRQRIQEIAQYFYDKIANDIEAQNEKSKKEKG